MPTDAATTFDAYVQHRSRTGRVLWADGIPWLVADHLLRPLTLPHPMRPVAREALRAILRASRAVAALWTDGWDTPPTGFWWTCCDRSNYDITTFTKYPRRDIGKGLEACKIRRLDNDWFAEHGYGVYAAFFKKRGLAPPLTAEQFSRDARVYAEYAGREVWGAFINGEIGGLGELSCDR